MKGKGAWPGRRGPQGTDSEYLAELRGRSPALALDPPALHTPPRRGPRTPGLRRTQPGLSKSCRGAFQSPRPSPKSGQADGASKDSLHLDIQKLKEKRDLLDKEITQLISEGYNVDELEDHISQLHEYNDIKDVGQMLLGKLAVIRGVTTKELYPEFGLDMND
ncbi:DNA repair protein SWI5 homolog [Mirounga angustirostris]|uniref:DNA repair protein SWI5 homolog n=1 Tax=Mirounga angustirostris TaxID=9716 RepID=UPI001E68D37C|nr:DNA repair protein SWI5 homolog [Mirounga angustirostris]